MRLALLALLLPSVLPAQTTHALIVGGVSGEPRIAQQIERDVELMRDGLSKRFNATTVVLTEKTTPRSEKSAITQALSKLTSDTKSGDQVLIVLVGHGSAQGGEARFNIPGPDITASELSQALSSLQGREIAVVVATSSSGAFLEPLSGSGRVVLTATKSGAQHEEVVFAQHFAKALSEDVADINKDGGVSIAEAFEYTKREVARFYQQQNRIATEAATLNGATADQFVLRASSRKAADPALRALYAERDNIQKQIAQLKERKATMAADAYEKELEQLLVQLAVKERQIRAAEQKDDQ
ncbi:MAG TPA: hypothetical protein VGD49_13270 [Longimicrobiales bacterium]